MRYAIAISWMTLVLGLTGCERASDEPSAASKPAAAPSPDKDDHDHTADDGHNHQNGGHGEERELGTVEVAGLSVRVVYHGTIAAGKEADFDVHIAQGSEKVTAARLWIGTPDGKGAMKAKATINKEEAHNHVEVPSPIAADAKLCIELELAGGEKKVGTLPLPE